MNRKIAKIELSTDEEIQEDPLFDFRAPSVETTIISEIPSAFELEQEIVIAPGEGKEYSQLSMTNFVSILLFCIFFLKLNMATK